MFKIFDKFPFLIAEVSEKKDGNMRISGDRGKDSDSLKNRKNFFQKFVIEESKTVIPLLSHGSKVLLVGKNETGNYVKEFDGFVSKEENIFLTITIADCLPVFFFEEKTGLFGLAHAGWRGIYGEILRSIIDLMQKNGASAENILVGIGPGISFCHFEINPVRDKSPEGDRRRVPERDSVSNGVNLLGYFKNYLSYPGVLRKDDKKYFLNLKEIAKIKLKEAGVPADNIEVSSECTFCCSKKYFSFRREKGRNLKTMVAVIGKN